MREVPVPAPHPPAIEPRPSGRAPLHALLLLASLLSLGQALAQQVDQPAAAELPVTSLVLFTSGVGYFEHSGTVTGNAEMELTVPEAAMDDMLQSLVVQDLDGGSVRPVRYPSRDPLGRILTSYSLDLSGDPTLAQLLSQARGEHVEIATSQTLSGRIVNVERVEVPEAEPSTYLTLATTSGLRRIDLAEVRAIRFSDSALQAELDEALAALARYRASDDQTLLLRFEGEGERRVSIGYVREMPVWKSSYRLLLGEDGQADLQGWAILDNPTDMDLEEVAVSFVAGRPISFVSNLFEPLYVQRERIDVRTTPNSAAEDALRNRQMDADRNFAEMERAAAAAAAPSFAPQLSGAGVEAMAQGSRTGATFSYRVDEPVSVGRHESAMIPIIDATVEAERLSVYSPGEQGLHPLRAVVLENDTGLHLAAGPVTIFGEGGFTGNAFLDDLVPGASRQLAYAVDLDLVVSQTSKSEPEQVVSVALVNGLLETSYRQRITTTYEVELRGDDPRFLVIEHPRRDGYEVVSPVPPPAQELDAFRFGVALREDAAGPPPGDLPTHLRCLEGEACELTIVLEREIARTLAVDNLSSEQIVFYLENVELSEEDRRVLALILDLKSEVADLDGRISVQRQQIDAIFRDQQRIRENMAQLDRDSTLYRRYLSDLESQEDELGGLRESVESLEEQRLDAQDRLDDLLRSLE